MALDSKSNDYVFRVTNKKQQNANYYLHITYKITSKGVILFCENATDATTGIIFSDEKSTASILFAKTQCDCRGLILADLYMI